ncbi:retroelement silencing factor 1 [Trichosurus vulpecula]|uniref:retroelement silencing factor 1 n=1 Tax=Trichosurus vulpecula TaxID=9337 RepID=UPI00186B3088|nr:retroelement silencing factor 1 [Trichosurus vulpecula]XP_036614951.1 retroelement silencing factor 1 [Trichosurus vulpecula]XP_036614952.1 retroelement silencing factor 1 [Trichosurus vulpecula]
MNWNTKPEDNAALPLYLESQSSFLRKALSPRTLTPQSSCNYSRNNQEVFVCSNNKNATLQSLQYHNIESSKHPQQASHPDMSSRVVVIPETSTERIPFSQLKVVPTSQPDQTSQRSLVAPKNSWLSSSVSDSIFFSRGLSGVTSQTGVGGSVHNAFKSQDQYVSSNTYTMQLQMLSSNPSKVPSLYPGNQASNLYSTEQQVGWVPPCTSSGLTLPFHQPSQYLDSQRGVVTNFSNTNIQKQPAVSATPLQVTNNQLLNPSVAVTAPPPPYPMVQSRQYAAVSTVTETNNRNLPNYYSRLIPSFQKNSQYLAENPSNEVLHTQQVHLSETKRVFGRDCQQQWQNTNENGHQKLNVETNCPFNEPGNSFAVGGIPHYKNKQMRTSLCDASSELLSKIPGPSNQINSLSLGEGSGFLGKSSASLREGSSSTFVKGGGSHREGSHSTNSEIDIAKESDSKITKEGLFRDIRKLLAMKNEFLKLAKEIKIKKSFLSESQDKTLNSSSLPQNPAMSLQLPSKDQSFPQLMSINSEHQPLTVMQSTEDTNKTNNTLNTSINEVDCCRQINQGNSALPSSAYSGKLQTEHVNALFQEPSPMCQKILSTINPTHTVSNQTPLDFNRGDRFDRPEQSEDMIKTSVAQQRQKVSKNKEDNYKLLSHLLKSNNTTLDFTPKIMNQETSAKGVSGNVQDCNKSIHSVVKQKTEVTSAQSQFNSARIPVTTGSNADGLDNSIKLKDKTSVLLSGKSCTKDNNYSMEELTACLALWKKAPSESTNIQKCDKLGKNKVSDGMSSPTAIRNINETVLPTMSIPIGHKHESGNLNLTKGIELQIAVVSPLILSESKPSNDQPLKSTKSSLQSVFPVIQEGSVCSLHDQVKEKVVASSNVDTIKRTETCVTTNNFALINKFDSKLQDVKSADGIVHSDINSSFSSETMKEKLGKSEPHLSHLEKDVSSLNNENSSGQGAEQNKEEQISKQVVDDTPLNDDLLQIASVCSLVEGDMSYNSQIANMFNCVSSTQVDKKEVSLPDNTVIDNRQLKEKLNQTKFESVSNFKGQNLLKITNVLPKISYRTKSLGTSKSFKLKHCETNDKIAKQKNDVEQNIEKMEVVSSKCCSSTDDQPDLNSKEIADISSTDFAKEPLSCMVQNIEQANNEIIFDEAASVKYLDGQLSELVEEFPYGIESADTHNIPAENKNSSLQLTMNSITKNKETSIKSNCDSEDPVNQIKITILSSECMKELFPKESKEICEEDDNLDKLENSQKKESITEVQNNCGSDVKTTGDDVNQDSIVPSTGKDDVHCCALGWLSTVYDGVPQCLCDSRKNIATEEKLDGQSSLSESLSYKADSATDRNMLATKINSPLKNNLQNSPAYPEGKRSLLEMEQDEIKCSPKGIEKEKPSFSPRKKIVKYNERDSQENPQKIFKARNLIPLHGEKRKSHFWSIKNKEFLKKECSSTEKLKRKFKSGCSKFRNPKWKLEQLNVSNMEQKKKKYQLEQKTSIVNGSKLCESLSSTNEENCEEKTSTDAKSTNLERNVHQDIMNTSNVNLNCTKSNGSPCEINKILSSQDYFQRQKQKEKIGKGDLKQRHESERFKKNRPHVSEWRNKLTIKLVNCAISNEGHNVRKYKRSLDNLAHHNKASKSHRSKIHHSKESKICGIARNVQEKVGEKQLDNVVILNRKITKYNQVPLQGKDQKEQKKLYLNRVAFKRTAQESICLTKLDCSPRSSVNKVKCGNDGNESIQDSFSLEKDEFEKPKMLEFKLCPEELFKNGNSEEHPDFKSFPRKEQVPVQGIKTTKEDWLKCIPQKKRKIEAVKDKDDNAVSNSRVYKRTLSVDECKAVQNLPNDSKTMFQTYKKLYLEKRSRSLYDSPTK